MTIDYLPQIHFLRDERNHLLQTLADIHLMVMRRETTTENEVADLLESEFGFTPPRV